MTSIEIKDAIIADLRALAISSGSLPELAYISVRAVMASKNPQWTTEDSAEISALIIEISEKLISSGEVIQRGV
jgi:hypothetical protein